MPRLPTAQEAEADAILAALDALHALAIHVVTGILREDGRHAVRVRADLIVDALGTKIDCLTFLTRTTRMMINIITYLFLTCTSNVLPAIWTANHLARRRWASTQEMLAWAVHMDVLRCLILDSFV